MKIGAFEAKAQFSALIERAAHGEEVIITKHGKPVAKLVAADKAENISAKNTFSELQKLRKTTTLDGISWQELRDEGRK